MRGEPHQGKYTRKLIRLQDLTLLLAVAAAAAWFLFPRGSSPSADTAAKVYLDSQEIHTLPLRAEDHYTLPLTEEYGVPVSFEVCGGAIRFVDVTCPDHICENTGFISTDGQTAVCMPNRVAVVIVPAA